jgi:hypothetical protein
VKTSVLFVLLFAACAAQTQSLRIVAVQLTPTSATPKTVQFFCTHNYEREACVNDAAALQRELLPYPLAQLGEWSFVLASADGWEDLVRSLGGDPVSPAFSVIEQRTTVLERSLFSANVSRNRELLLTFGVLGGALLNLAVTHELGHAICQDKDERRADDYGRELRDKRAVECPKSTVRKIHLLPASTWPALADVHIVRLFQCEMDREYVGTVFYLYLHCIGVRLKSARVQVGNVRAFLFSNESEHASLIGIPESLMGRIKVGLEVGEILIALN